jgi:hypothetical protein
VPEFIDPVFTKTSPKRSFSLNRKRAFWLVFAKTGSIISGTGHKNRVLNSLKETVDYLKTVQLNQNRLEVVGILVRFTRTMFKMFYFTLEFFKMEFNDLNCLLQKKTTPCTNSCAL